MVNSDPLYKAKLMSKEAFSLSCVVTRWATESRGSLLDALMAADDKRQAVSANLYRTECTIRR